jgi:hypothetical protein
MVPITKSTQILVEREAKNFFSYKRTHGGWSGSQLWIQYISPYSIFTPQNTELENLATQRKTLTIHFRSGDIFQGNGAHGKYFQPPLKYYRDIISGGTDSGEPWSAIILMSEDTNNPV